MAGSVVRFPASRGIAVSGQPDAVSYGYSSGQVPSGYLADVSLDGFLLCNEFGAAQGSETSSFESIYLRPRHGAWLFGSLDAPGVTGSVTGIAGVSYANGALSIQACRADGTGAFDDDGNSISTCGGAFQAAGAALQCYVADANGLGVADTRQLFYDGFDAQAVNTTNSWVSIQVTHLPQSIDDTFNYTVTVTLPSADEQEGEGTESLATSQYVLKEGYDSSVFSSCTTLLGGGQLISGSTSFTRQCKMINPAAQLPTDVPVVNAALFTNATTLDSDYSDNVAFGYPVITQ